MALKFSIAIPLFLPTNPTPSDHRPTTEIRFSRWNNANAQKFVREEETQKEIEDEIRFRKRFNSADKIAEFQPNDNSPSCDNDPPRFKSTGTPSSPSRPSIPGKASKYSKTPKPADPHPAFRPLLESRKLFNLVAPAKEKAQARLNITEKGVSYVIPGAPFEYQYSYTETPKVKPLKLREAPYAPFGPTTMPRPWTGCAPLPPSKKKAKDFDSFRLPPPHKKGVKPVQAPGPYLAGSGPKYVMSREEILGEPLTKEEAKDLIIQCVKTSRQMNIGRDGLTHNMLDNIHAHWQRRRVCKIKCKGVCTVDMDNVRQQLEEKTGGKIIFSRGGVIYLFRGRNYNYRNRPRYPLMLWKPITPLYPRLVKRAPDGLTLEEAIEMRAKGRQLMPICKLGKNGVYCDLVNTVREAFEECEVVRINCQGLNSSDYHRIGAKLMELVPCVIVSFEHEHILLWRGKDWKSTMVTPDDLGKESDTGNVVTEESSVINDLRASDENSSTDHHISDDGVSDLVHDVEISTNPAMTISENADIHTIEESSSDAVTEKSSFINDSTASDEDKSRAQLQSSDILDDSVFYAKPCLNLNPSMEKLEILLKQAVEIGSAVMLDSDCLDADIVYDRSVSLARSAPPELVFKKQQKGKFIARERKDTDDLNVEEEEEEQGEEVETAYELVKENGGKGRKTLKKKMSSRDEFPNAALPQGSLAIDELAKLLAY